MSVSGTAASKLVGTRRGGEIGNDAACRVDRERAQHVVELLARATRDDDLCTFSCQLDGDGQADARRGSRDDRGLASQLQIHGLTSR